MNVVRPIKTASLPGVPRIQPMALTLDRLRAAMDAKGKPSPMTANVVDLLAGRKRHGP